MANKRSDYQNREGSREPDTTYSGKSGERERNTPGRNPGDLGLDSDEMRGHDILGEPSGRAGDMSFSDTGDNTLRDRGMTDQTDRSEEGGYSTSSGRSGTDRGQGSRSVSGDPMERSGHEDSHRGTSGKSGWRNRDENH